MQDVNSISRNAAFSTSKAEDWAAAAAFRNMIKEAAPLQIERRLLLRKSEHRAVIVELLLLLLGRR